MAIRDIEFTVRGMTCETCSSRVENSIRTRVEGIEDVKVDLESEKALVRFDESKADPDQLVKAVELAGYQAVLQETKEGEAGTWL